MNTTINKIILSLVSVILFLSCSRDDGPLVELSKPVEMNLPSGVFLKYDLSVNLTEFPDMSYVDWTSVTHEDTLFLFITDDEKREKVLSMTAVFESLVGDVLSLSLYIDPSSPLESDNEYRATMKIKIHHGNLPKIFTFYSFLHTNSAGGIESLSEWRLLYCNVTDAKQEEGDLINLPGTGTAENPFIVSSDKDLYIIHTDMEDDIDKGKGYYFVQSDDISLRKSNVFYQDQRWVPLCDGFAGHYDGKNHIITDLDISFGSTSQSENNMGFFRSLGEGAEIKNLTFESPSFSNCGSYVGVVAATAADGVTLNSVWVNSAHITGASYVGGLIGQSGNITINNCLLKGMKITVLADGSDVGGLVGNLTDNTGGSIIYKNYIQDLLINAATDISTTNVGGTVGYAICPNGLELRSNYYQTSMIDMANGTSDNHGGFVGAAEGSLLVNNCTFAYSVSAEAVGEGIIPIYGHSYVGGAVGKMTPGGSCNGYSGLEVLDCAVNTAVKGSGDYVGGVVGIINKGSGHVYIHNMTLSDGQVIGGDFTGGFVGYSSSLISIGADEESAKYYQSLAVSGTDYVGGVIGYNESEETVSVSNIKLNANVTGAQEVGGLAGYSYDINVADFYTTPTITVKGESCVGGLFGILWGTAGFSGNTVYELFVNDAATAGNSPVVGGIVGEAIEATISGVTFAGTASGESSVGGIVGYANGLTISDCHNTGSGIRGSDAMVGGIVGRTAHNAVISVTDCTNSAPVIASGNHAGGILGGTNDNNEDGDVNGGTVITISNCSNTCTVEGSASVGGILGFSKYPIDIKNCVNASSATISGTEKCGGIVGATGQQGDFDNYGSRFISQCANYASINASSTAAGGIAGYLYQGFKITECLNAGFISAEEECCGGIVGQINVGSNVEQFPKDAQYIKNCLNTADSSCPLYRAGIIGSKDEDISVDRLYVRRVVNMSQNTGWGIFGHINYQPCVDQTESTILYAGTGIEDASNAKYYEKWRKSIETLTSPDIYEDQDFSTDIWNFPSGGSYPSLKNVPADIL